MHPMQHIIHPALLHGRTHPEAPCKQEVHNMKREEIDLCSSDEVSLNTGAAADGAVPFVCVHRTREGGQAGAVRHSARRWRHQRLEEARRRGWHGRHKHEVPAIKVTETQEGRGDASNGRTGWGATTLKSHWSSLAPRSLNSRGGPGTFHCRRSVKKLMLGQKQHFHVRDQQTTTRTTLQRTQPAQAMATRFNQ